jgi:hypothetical protein
MEVIMSQGGGKKKRELKAEEKEKEKVKVPSIPEGRSLTYQSLFAEASNRENLSQFIGMRKSD